MIPCIYIFSFVKICWYREDSSVSCHRGHCVEVQDRAFLIAWGLLLLKPNLHKHSLHFSRKLKHGYSLQHFIYMKIWVQYSIFHFADFCLFWLTRFRTCFKLLWSIWLVLDFQKKKIIVPHLEICYRALEKYFNK